MGSFTLSVCSFLQIMRLCILLWFHPHHKWIKIWRKQECCFRRNSKISTICSSDCKCCMFLHILPQLYPYACLIISEFTPKKAYMHKAFCIHKYNLVIVVFFLVSSL